MSIRVADALLFVTAAPVSAACAYLAVLAFGSRRPRPGLVGESVSFDVVVPAHDEETGIAATIASLLAVEYPRSRFRLIVVADNCSDSTADRARAAGALVLERRDSAHRGKGYALAHGFEFSARDGVAHAVVVVDADSVVSPNLLRTFAGAIEGGAEAMQAEYRVRNHGDSWRTRLMTIALTLFHTVRSLARERFGLSCGLRGNGMCFTHAVLTRAPHEAFSLVEDVEYGVALGLAGIRVTYVSEANVAGEMPATEQASRSQRTRWEGGRWRLARLLVPRLVSRARTRRDKVALDLALDLLIPPLTTLAAASVIGTILATIAIVTGLATWRGIAGWFIATACLSIYVARGCVLSGGGPRVLLDLLWAPVYALWKFTLLFRRRTKVGEWIRTARAVDR